MAVRLAIYGVFCETCADKLRKDCAWLVKVDVQIMTDNEVCWACDIRLQQTLPDSVYEEVDNCEHATDEEMAQHLFEQGLKQVYLGHTVTFCGEWRNLEGYETAYILDYWVDY